MAMDQKQFERINKLLEIRTKFREKEKKLKVKSTSTRNKIHTQFSKALSYLTIAYSDCLDCFQKEENSVRESLNDQLMKVKDLDRRVLDVTSLDMDIENGHAIDADLSTLQLQAELKLPPMSYSPGVCDIKIAESIMGRVGSICTSIKLEPSLQRLDFIHGITDTATSGNLSLFSEMDSAIIGNCLYDPVPSSNNDTTYRYSVTQREDEVMIGNDRAASSSPDPGIGSTTVDVNSRQTTSVCTNELSRNTEASSSNEDSTNLCAVTLLDELKKTRTPMSADINDSPVVTSFTLERSKLCGFVNKSLAKTIEMPASSLSALNLEDLPITRYCSSANICQSAPFYKPKGVRLKRKCQSISQTATYCASHPVKTLLQPVKPDVSACLQQPSSTDTTDSSKLQESDYATPSGNKDSEAGERDMTLVQAFMGIAGCSKDSLAATAVCTLCNVSSGCICTGGAAMSQSCTKPAVAAMCSSSSNLMTFPTKNAMDTVMATSFKDHHGHKKNSSDSLILSSVTSSSTEKPHQVSFQFQEFVDETFLLSMLRLGSLHIVKPRLAFTHQSIILSGEEPRTECSLSSSIFIRDIEWIKFSLSVWPILLVCVNKCAALQIELDPEGSYDEYFNPASEDSQKRLAIVRLDLVEDAMSFRNALEKFCCSKLAKPGMLSEVSWIEAEAASSISAPTASVADSKEFCNASLPDVDGGSVVDTGLMKKETPFVETLLDDPLFAQKRPGTEPLGLAHDESRSANVTSLDVAKTWTLTYPIELSSSDTDDELPDLS